MNDESELFICSAKVVRFVLVQFHSILARFKLSSFVVFLSNLHNLNFNLLHEVSDANIDSDQTIFTQLGIESKSLNLHKPSIGFKSKNKANEFTRCTSLIRPVVEIKKNVWRACNGHSSRDTTWGSSHVKGSRKNSLIMATVWYRPA